MNQYDYSKIYNLKKENLLIKNLLPKLFIIHHFTIF